MEDCDKELSISHKLELIPHRENTRHRAASLLYYGDRRLRSLPL